jgi:hypothetical protein
MATLPPMLILNPRADPAFVARAQALAAGGARTPEQLQAAMRADYPLAVVRERGLSTEVGSAWYVYRDGHWVDGRV